MAAREDFPDYPEVEPTRRALSKGNVSLGLGVALTATLLYYIAYANRAHTGWSTVLNSVAASLTAALVFSLADYILSRKEYARYIENLGRIVLSELRSLEFQSNAVANARDVGLIQVFPWDRNDECRHAVDKMIRDATSITVLLNRGGTWVLEHKDAFKSRFADESKETSIFLLHPTEEFVKTQAAKEELTLEEMQRKQVATVKVLDSLGPHGRRSYKVRGHKFFHPYLLVLADTEAIVAPYYAAQGKGKPPAMWFKKTEGEYDYYTRLRDDVGTLAAPANSVDIGPWFDEKIATEA